MIVNHNTSALFAHRQLNQTASRLGASIEKLSSGSRINKAGDDASGLAVSERFRSRIRGMQQASRNAQDGISFLQVAEGSMQEMHSILHRMRELSIQAANQIYSAEDREQIQLEVGQLVQEIDRIVDVTSFNNLKILDGSLTELRFHVGPDADEYIEVTIGAMDTETLEVREVDISTAQAANQGLGFIDNAVNSVSSQRASVGALQNRMTHVVNTLELAVENMGAAESRIRDTDIAREIIEFTRNEVMTNVSTAMLAHANLQSGTVMQLLG